MLTALLALARFSPAFLVLKAHDVGIDAAFVPAILMLRYLVYSTSAYPFGLLVDRSDRHVQLTAGIAVLISADLAFAFADTIWMTMLGAALWGLQMGITQGLLATVIADTAPARLRGTAFGIFDLAAGVATFSASAGAGAIWMAAGPTATFSIGASVAAIAVIVLLLRPAIAARER